MRCHVCEIPSGSLRLLPRCYLPEGSTVEGAREVGSPSQAQETGMIILGVLLLIIGIVASISILYSIGVILIVVGVILEVLSMMGRAVGGRRHYY